jgi:MFS family permease
VTGTLAPFAIPSFRLLWGSRLLSSMGFWMDNVATGWLALEVGGGPAAVGTIFALRLLPFLLFGIISGTVSDRFPRRSLLIWVSLVSAVLSATTAALALGSIAFWQLAVIAFLSGTAAVFDFPTRTAFAVDLVGRERLAQGVALTAVAFYVFGAVGAFAAGQIVAGVGPAGAYVAIAVGHLGAALLVRLIRLVPPREAALDPPTGFAQAMGGAARLIWENPGVRMVVIASVVVELFGYSYQSAVPPLARDVLGVGPDGLGTLNATASIGATLAVVLLAFLPQSLRRQPMTTGVILLWGLAQVALAVAPSFGFALVGMLLAGGCAAAIDTLQQTIVQLAVPEEHRGRAMGVWVFSIGTNAIGFYQVGLVGAAGGPAASLWVNGVGAIVCAVVILAMAPSYRWRYAHREVGNA